MVGCFSQEITECLLASHYSLFTPACNNACSVGFIPSTASGFSGYWGWWGLWSPFDLICTGSAPFISPSAGPCDHNVEVSDSILSSSSVMRVYRCHSPDKSSAVICFFGVRVTRIFRTTFHAFIRGLLKTPPPLLIQPVWESISLIHGPRAFQVPWQCFVIDMWGTDSGMEKSSFASRDKSPRCQVYSIKFKTETTDKDSPFWLCSKGERSLQTVIEYSFSDLRSLSAVAFY